MFTVVEINSGTHEESKSHIQDIMHVQEPRASVYKQVTHTVETISLTV